MRSDQSGFTIIELLIATAVFTVLLIIASAALIGISQTYIRGSVQDETQQSARKVLTDISQDILYNDPTGFTLPPTTYTVGPPSYAPVTNDEYYFCIGGDVYVYRLDRSLLSSVAAETTPWALVRYSSTSCPTKDTTEPSTASNNLTTDGFPAGASELLASNERLGQLVFDDSTYHGFFSSVINITVGYGDDDLLNDIASVNADINNAVSPNETYLYACQSGSDNSFCAVSTLTTTIAPRINNPQG
jgi:prepilin-type N-terminal cleavage/methylation domain-containing protein